MCSVPSAGSNGLQFGAERSIESEGRIVGVTIVEDGSRGSDITVGRASGIVVPRNAGLGDGDVSDDALVVSEGGGEGNILNILANFAASSSDISIGGDGIGGVITGLIDHIDVLGLLHVTNEGVGNENLNVLAGPVDILIAVDLLQGEHITSGIIADVEVGSTVDPVGIGVGGVVEVSIAIHVGASVGLDEVTIPKVIGLGAVLDAPASSTEVDLSNNERSDRLDNALTIDDESKDTIAASGDSSAVSPLHGQSGGGVVDLLGGVGANGIDVELIAKSGLSTSVGNVCINISVESVRSKVVVSNENDGGIVADGQIANLSIGHAGDILLAGVSGIGRVGGSRSQVLDKEHSVVVDTNSNILTSVIGILAILAAHDGLALGNDSFGQVLSAGAESVVIVGERIGAVSVDGVCDQVVVVSLVGAPSGVEGSLSRIALKIRVAVRSIGTNGSDDNVLQAGAVSKNDVSNSLTAEGGGAVAQPTDGLDSEVVLGGIGQTDDVAVSVDENIIVTAESTSGLGVAEEELAGIVVLRLGSTEE